jgi:hypothetical protein
MKQLHNALCHPAAILPQAVETSQYKSHIQAPFPTYGTGVMLASVHLAVAHVVTGGFATLSHKTLSPNDVVSCLDMDAHL